MEAISLIFSKSEKEADATNPKPVGLWHQKGSAGRSLLHLVWKFCTGSLPNNCLSHAYDISHIQRLKAQLFFNNVLWNIYEGGHSFIIDVKVFLIWKELETSISEEILVFLFK